MCEIPALRETADAYGLKRRGAAPAAAKAERAEGCTEHMKGGGGGWLRGGVCGRGNRVLVHGQ